jgi:hypothetical protein
MVHTKDSEGLQTLPNREAPEVLPFQAPPQSYHNNYHSKPQQWNLKPDPQPDQRPRTTCGLRKSTFILACLLGAVIAAVVAIGIVLGLKTKDSNNR